MSDLTATQRRTAAQNLASVWNDGKRRVVVTQQVHFRHNGQSITKDPTEVIDDVHTIALLEEHGIEFIDLEVNGQPKRGKLLPADVDRAKNIDELAGALGIMPNLLHAAVNDGGQHVGVAAKAIVDRFAPPGENLGHGEVIPVVRVRIDHESGKAQVEFENGSVVDVTIDEADALITAAQTAESENADAQPAEGETSDSPEWKPGDKE